MKTTPKIVNAVTDTNIYDLADIGLWHCQLFGISTPPSTEGLAEIGQRVCNSKGLQIEEAWDHLKEITKN